MEENVSGCFFSEHSVDSLLQGSAVGYPSDSLDSCFSFFFLYFFCYVC